MVKKSKYFTRSVILFVGAKKHAARQYFPNISSESDLQKYKAVPFKVKATHEPMTSKTSSSLSNVPSDSNKTKVIIYLNI